MAYLSTKEIENPIRNKKTVSTSLLWRTFCFVWIGFMSFLFYNLLTNIGGSVMEEMQDSDFKTDFKNNSGDTLYPKYDSDGYLLLNPYQSLKAE